MSGTDPVIPLGRLIGTRSGDKGGDANIGIWIPAAVPQPDAAYGWLTEFLTVEQVHELLPQTRGCSVDVYPLPNLRAINVVIHGLLERGVSHNALLDPQAKGLGELLRARCVAIPAALIPDESVDLA